MERFADWLSEKLYLNGKIKIEEMDDIAFALEVVISHIISFGTILLIGFILNKNIESAIFIFMFGLFRTLNNTYHAKTFFQCFILTVGSFLLSMLTSYIIHIEFQMQFIVFLCTLNIVMILVNYSYNQSVFLKYSLLMIVLNMAVIFVLPIFENTILIFVEMISAILIISTISVDKTSEIA